MIDLPSSLLAVLQRAQQQDPLGELIHGALVLIESVLDLLGEEKMAISFNGGKDCTVLLHIYAAVLYARHASGVSQQLKPKPDPHVTIPPWRGPQNCLSSTEYPISPSLNPLQSAQTPPPISSTSSTKSSPHPYSTHHRPSISLPYPLIRSVYITALCPFPQLDRFVIASTKLYGLDLWRFGGGMKDALEQWLSCKENDGRGGGSGVEAVMIGTRKGDPNDAVEVIAPTDPSWPPFLRVHPILHWTYADVWNFLLEFQVPYCELYDLGYTSLGSTTNTSPNPLLKKSDVNGGWEPAYKCNKRCKPRTSWEELARAIDK
nr:FMN adenylyltransferase [Cryptococcus depauperatus CBS 7855]